MELTEQLGFEDWVEWCFGGMPEDAPMDAGLYSLPPVALAGYMSRLMHDSGRLLAWRDRGSLAKGLWFVFGGSSGYWHDLVDDSVPEALQVRAYEGLRLMYRDLFDRYGDQAGTRPAGSTNEFDDLDTAVYMLWDMSTIEVPVLTGLGHLVEPAFAVLEQGLACQTVACQVSALHGLGHLQHRHPVRVKKLIEDFLRRGRPRLPWVATYAQAALRGNVL